MLSQELCFGFTHNLIAHFSAAEERLHDVLDSDIKHSLVRHVFFPPLQLVVFAHSWSWGTKLFSDSDPELLLKPIRLNPLE